VNGCYTSSVKNQTTGETTVTAYYFDKGKLKTGKIRVYDNETHTTVTRKFDSRTGACVYTK
ncbi:MAG: hypothetical protein II800_05480, partial [Lachnospiraceae bacterium]|nr:hypothetical protein [Lachnospiraceae bacterium]